MQFYVRRDNQMVYYTAYNKEKPKISQVLQFYYKPQRRNDKHLVAFIWISLSVFAVLCVLLYLLWIYYRKK